MSASEQSRLKRLHEREVDVDECEDYGEVYEEIAEEQQGAVMEGKH